MRTCSQEERLHQLKKVCTERERARANKWMEPRTILALIDQKHKLMVCYMSKAGCTAIKSLLLEAAGYKVSEAQLGHDLMALHITDILKDHGLKFFKDLTRNEAAEVVDGEDYSRFISIRHPFERLLSVYRGKILDPKSDAQWLITGTLKLAYPDQFKTNKTLLAMQEPQSILGNPTFAQFLEWIWRRGIYDAHWSMIVDACHPCAYAWDAVLRMETMVRDSTQLVELLKPDIPYDSMPVRHSHQDKALQHHHWLTMPEYDAISEEIIDSFLNLYKIDMEMFGYRWDKATNTASCVIQTDYGPCC